MTRPQYLDTLRHCEALTFACLSRDGHDRPSRLARLRHALACLRAAECEGLGAGDVEVRRRVEAGAERVLGESATDLDAGAVQ